MSTAVATPPRSISQAFAPPETPVDKKAFGRRLRELRIKAGLSQSALGDLSGLNQSQISKWEEGESVPLITTAPDLAAALGVSVEALFVEPHGKAPQPPQRGRPRKKRDENE